MLKTVKALHLLAMAMFLGSILGHITAGFIPGAQDDPQTLLIVRQSIAVATTYLTLPGLGLLFVTGVLLIFMGKLPVPRTRWLAAHAILALLIALNAAVVLYPTGQEALDAASRFAAGAGSLEQLHALKGREAGFGAVNLLLALAAVFLAVLRPRLGAAKT